MKKEWTFLHFGGSYTGYYRKPILSLKPPSRMPLFEEAADKASQSLARLPQAAWESRFTELGVLLGVYGFGCGD